MAIFYGAADTFSAVAYANVDEIIAYVKENSWK
jgi:beta-1,4-mannooligosaccharide/beta-1,4-mannosyl-N-acetylglucosamine phosphorylase